MALLNQEERHLVIIQGLNFFAYQLSGIFVTVFLFVNSDLKTTFTYRLWMFSSLLFFYFLSGFTLRKISSGNLMKIGLLAGAIYYFALFLLQGHAIQYLLPLAILDGFAAGNYWAAFNLNQYIFSDKNKRERFFGISGSVIAFLNAIAPTIGGAIIVLAGTGSLLGVHQGYAALFFIVFLLLGATALFIGKLPSHEIPSFRYRDLITHKRTKTWWLVLCQQAVWGFTDMAFGTMTGVLFYLIIKQEFWLGLTQSVGFFISAGTGLIAGKLLSRNHRYFWIGVIGLFIANVLLALMQNIYGIWTVVIISGLFAPFLFTLVSTLSFQTIDKNAEHWKDAYHFLLERDIATGGARILSFLLLILFMNEQNQLDIIRISLYLMPLLPLILGLLVWRNEKLRSFEVRT